MQHHETKAIPRIVRRWKEAQGYTLDELWAAIHAAFLPHVDFSRSAIISWYNGDRNPDYIAILFLYEHTRPDTWINKMALEIMEVLRPELYGEGQAPSSPS